MFGLRRTREPEPEARKRRSERILRRRGIPLCSWMGTIGEDELALRSPQEVARRTLCVAIVASAADPEADGVFDALALLTQKGVVDDLSPEERAFLDSTERTEADRGKLNWRYEGAYVLLWALGYVPKLIDPARVCDVTWVIRQLDGVPAERLIGGAMLRPTGEILDELDFILRLHWAVVEAELGRAAPPPVHPRVVYERHYTLNWLTGYGGQDWDDVSTDT